MAKQSTTWEDALQTLKYIAHKLDGWDADQYSEPSPRMNAICDAIGTADPRDDDDSVNALLASLLYSRLGRQETK